MICFALKLAPWPLNKRKMGLHHWMKNNNITMCSCKITFTKSTNAFIKAFVDFVEIGDFGEFS